MEWFHLLVSQVPESGPGALESFWRESCRKNRDLLSGGDF
jgi:hypothetical protein